MTVRAKPKPSAAVETARVVKIHDWLVGELGRKAWPPDAWSRLTAAALIAAERIAARTED